MKSNTLFKTLALGASISSVAAAQQRPAIRQIGAVIAKSSEPFVNIVALRPLKDGRVLLNDVGGRRIVLFAADLKNLTLIADSTSATSNAYAGRQGGLIPFRGDSTLFVDPSSQSMLVLDPMGRVARVMSVPRTRDAGMLTNGQAGTPGFDPRGKLIYREFPNIRPPGFGPNGMTAPPVIPESTAIIRVDLATRSVDTLGFAKIPKVKLNINQSDDGRVRITTQVNPLSMVDDWAVLPDGSLAIIRGSDYHVDWVNPDGTRVSSAKIPFDWQRLTDDDKVAFIDSVKAARARIIAAQPVVASSTAPVTRPPAGSDGGGGGGGNRIVIGGGGGPGGGLGAVPAGLLPQVEFVSPSELPDYKPPFFPGSTHVDLDGSLWIRTIPTKAIAGGPVYDVVNRKGELVERVQVPLNTTLVGFGTGGTAYLALTDGKSMYLEAARVR